MRWLLLLIPMTAYAANGDDTVYSIGLVILSAAATVYKTKRYMDTKMKDNIQTLVDTKPAITAAVAGGALTFTATNVISLFGLLIGVIGMVVGILQWRENRRRNNLLERELNWKMGEEDAAKEREVQKSNLGQHQKGNCNGEVTTSSNCDRPQ